MPTEVIDTRELEQLIEDISDANLGVVINDITTDAMLQAVLIVQNAVAQRTPVGVTGDARSNIKQDIYGRALDAEGIFGMVYMPAAITYGKPLEYGSRPHFPPPKALELWVKRVLGVPDEQVKGVAFLVARKIAGQSPTGKKGGTKGAHMFEKGWEASEQYVNDIWDAVPDRIIEELAK